MSGPVLEPVSGPVRAWVALGANLGDANAALDSAFSALAALPHTRLVARSSRWRSAPIDAPGDDYLNAVAALDTGLDPHALLAALQAIEHAHGRQREPGAVRHAPRTLDLDLLLHGDHVLASPSLTLPHPRMAERAFVLRPLAELAPGLVLPGQGAVATLLERVAGQRIEKLAA